MSVCTYVRMYVCMNECMYVYVCDKVARRLFLVASRPMLIPFEHRHLVTFLQCQFLQCSSAKPLRQTNVKACQLQLSRNKSRRVSGRFNWWTMKTAAACPKVTGLDYDARAEKYLAAKGQNAYMQLAIKATCVDTIHSVCSTCHERFDLAVATPLFPHGVNNGSRRKRREYYDDFNRWPTKKTAPALRS